MNKLLTEPNIIWLPYLKKLTSLYLTLVVATASRAALLVFSWLMLCIPLAHPGSAKGNTNNEIWVQTPKMLKTFCLTEPIVFRGFQYYQS